MWHEKLKDYKIILASGSPRRQELMKGLGIDFSIDVRKVEEIHPSHLKASEITDYLSELKAKAFPHISENEIVITGDTLVWKDGGALGKPKNRDGAMKMLRLLSGGMHEVITSVCFTGKNYQTTVNDTTKVWFNPLTEAEIYYYVNTFRPFDKAGAYGIQEWIGLMGIGKIEGSYFNVMGLPTHLVYKTLMEIAKR